MNQTLGVVCLAACLTGGCSLRSEAQASPQPEPGVCTIVGYMAEEDVPDDVKLDHSPLEITFRLDGKKIGKLSIPSSTQLKFPCTAGDHAMDFEVKNKALGATAHCVTSGLYVSGVYSPWVQRPDRRGNFKCMLHRLEHQ